MQTKIFIASDHAGFELKKFITSNSPEVKWIDLGPISTVPVDFPDFADKVASEVNKGNGFGVLICGSGQGMAMRANKYPQVRAALCWDIKSAELARRHNDANLLCLGEREIKPELGLEIFRKFLSTSFEGGRHILRVNKINQPILQ